MDTVVPLPAPKRVHDLFADLLGRNVELAPKNPSLGDVPADWSVAVYRDEAGNPVAAVTADRALSSFLAAALALRPKDFAEEVAVGGEFPEDFAENLREIFSIIGGLFNAKGSGPVRFHSLSAPGASAPPASRALACRPGRRMDLEISIHGYGAGALALVG